LTAISELVENRNSPKANNRVEILFLLYQKLGLHLKIQAQKNALFIKHQEKEEARLSVQELSCFLL
jgi:hypothetical protein